MKRQTKPHRWSLFHTWLLLLGGLIVAGLVAGSLVFRRGLVVTNLTDLVPWGLWIAIDLSAIALSAGAFLMSAAVYLLGLKQFRPLARTAVFIGFTGYSMALLCLLLDIGRPDRFWHALVYWNPHSPLWEVTMCVALYFSVLLMEVMPILGQAEWLQGRWPRLGQGLQRFHHLAPVLAVAGLFLSLLHQSSLGATYGVLSARPIWYRPGLAVLFIASAMAAGPALAVLASMIAARVTPRARVQEALLEQAAAFVGWALLATFYLRFWDMLAMNYTPDPGRDEGVRLLLSGPLAFNFWVGEVALGMVVPLVLLLKGRWRRRPLLRAVALALVVGGLIAYRWDTNMVGQMVVFTYLPQSTTPLYTHYTPALVELAAGTGIVAFGLLLFTLGVRYLHVVDHAWIPGRGRERARASGPATAPPYAPPVTPLR